MTLVLNEFHGRGPRLAPLIVAAADRRVSNADGSYHSTRRKLFALPRVSGAVSCFGLAGFDRQGHHVYFSEWLPAFIARTAAISPGDFARALFQELNPIVGRRLLAGAPSGFHICGFDTQGRPDFWFMSNIGRMDGFEYTDLRPGYDPPASHLLGRDAPGMRLDPLTGRAPVGSLQLYRNGDFRAHAVASEFIDRALASLGHFPDFQLPTTPAEYGEYVRFKFEVIAHIYKKWAHRKVIGTPIDVLVLQGPNQPPNHGLQPTAAGGILSRRG